MDPNSHGSSFTPRQVAKVKIHALPASKAQRAPPVDLNGCFVGFPRKSRWFKSWDDGRGFLLRWRSWIQWHCCFVKMKPWKPYGFSHEKKKTKDFPVTEIPPLHQSIDSMSWPLGTMSATLLRSAKHQRSGNWKTWIQSTKMRICPYVNFQQSLQWKSLKFDENISQPGSLCGCRLPCHGRFGRFGRFGQCPQFWTHDLYTWIGHDGPRAN